MIPQRNNAADFLQYVTSISNPASLFNNSTIAQLKQKYSSADPRMIAQQMAQAKGISPQQLDQIAKQLGIIQ